MASRRGRRLPAILGTRPKIMIVGINPSLRSAEVGHHFAGPGNPFWRLLHAARLIPGAFTYADDIRLPEHGLALTNIVPRATRAASELTAFYFGPLVSCRVRLELADADVPAAALA